jgi:hypothetical protein
MAIITAPTIITSIDDSVDISCFEQKKKRGKQKSKTFTKITWKI